MSNRHPVAEVLPTRPLCRRRAPTAVGRPPAMARRGRQQRSGQRRGAYRCLPLDVRGQRARRRSDSTTDGGRDEPLRDQLPGQQVVTAGCQPRSAAEHLVGCGVATAAGSSPGRRGSRRSRQSRTVSRSANSAGVVGGSAGTGSHIRRTANRHRPIRRGERWAGRIGGDRCDKVLTTRDVHRGREPREHRGRRGHASSQASYALTAAGTTCPPPSRPRRPPRSARPTIVR